MTRTPSERNEVRAGLFVLGALVILGFGTLWIVGFKPLAGRQTSYEVLMKGTKYGPVVIPGDPLSSTLTMLVEGRADPSIRMPHGDEPLPAAEQKVLRDWVAQGARDN